MFPIILGAGILLTSVFSLSGCKSKKESENKSSIPSESNQTQRQTSCYYRRSLEETVPFDYYLWQGERNCKDSSCAPEPPPIFTTREEITAYEGNNLRPNLLNVLPANRSDLSVYLNFADQIGLITWVDDLNTQVYEVIQHEIDSAIPGQDVHIVFGFAHRVVGQTSFFNELLVEGSDGQKIQGVTHIALEFEGVDQQGLNVQTDLDHYLVAGISQFLPVISFAPGDRVNYPNGAEEEILDKNYLLKLGYDHCYNTVLADVPGQISRELRQLLGNYYSLGAREIYAVERVWQRQNPSERDVVFWSWGANHAEKYRLPFYIKINDPFAKVVSIIVNGGTFIPSLIFDQALMDLDWLEKPFILKLDGFREADYIIHIPTEGRVIPPTWEVRKGSVVNQLFDPF